MRNCSWSLLNRLYQPREEKNWVAEATEELDVWLLRKEVPERSGASVNGLLREEVAQQGHVALSSLIHPSIHPHIFHFIHPFVRLVKSLIH